MPERLSTAWLQLKSIERELDHWPVLWLVEVKFVAAGGAVAST